MWSTLPLRKSLFSVKGREANLQRSIRTQMVPKSERLYSFHYLAGNVFSLLNITRKFIQVHTRVNGDNRGGCVCVCSTLTPFGK